MGHVCKKPLCLQSPGQFECVFTGKLNVSACFYDISNDNFRA